MIISCSKCHTINRVPDERAHDGAICANCKALLLPAESVDLTDTSFDKVIGTTQGVPVVVDFWAPWCGPCRMMAPMYHQAASQLRGEAILAKLDTEANRITFARFVIRSIPTVVIFLDGQELARFSGARSSAEIVHWVRDQKKASLNQAR